MLPKFKKRDDIPEAFRDEYHEVNGEWVPKPDPDADDAKELKETLKKERDARAAAEKEAKKLQKEKDDAERDEKLKGKGGLTDDKLKEIRAEVRADLDKEYGPIKTDLEKLKGENRTIKLDNSVKGMFGHKDVKVRSERHDALWKLIGDRFDLTEDGKPFVRDKPGTPVEKYLADVVKKEYPELFEGSQAAGGGAAGAGGTGTQTTGATASGASSADLVMSNPGAALQAARAAGVKE